MSTAELVSDLKLDFAVMRPSLQDLVRLGASSRFLLPLAMQRWERVFIEKNRDWIRSADLRTIVQRIDSVTSAMLGRVSHGCNFECHGVGGGRSMEGGSDSTKCISPPFL